MGIKRLARAPVNVAARAGRDILTAEIERTIDTVAAGDLPEHLARTIAEQHVIERVLDELSRANGADGKAPLDELMNHLIETGVLDRLVNEIVDSPVFRNAVAHKGSAALQSFRGRCAGFDDAVEERVLRWTRRPPARPERRGFAGVVSRVVGLVVDAAAVNLLFVGAVGSVALIFALLHLDASVSIAAAGMGIGWSVLVLAYFAGSWCLVGATPGMRLVGTRIIGPDGRPPSVARALLRAVWLVVALAPVLLGFLPVLFSRHRRAVQDFVAGTTVVRDGQPAAAV
jgi:uncharacterized RDD family membrane protein YckC